MIDFLLNWVPSIVFQLMLVAGALGTIALTLLDKFIPIIYEDPLKLITTICLALGLMHIGYDYSEDKWKAKDAVTQLELQKLQTQAAKVTTETVVKYVDRVQVVHEKGETIEKKIPVYITVESDAKCTIPLGFVRAHNASAVSGTASSADEAGSETGTATGVPSNDTATDLKLSETAAVINRNYTRYHELEEQLRSLQEWVTQQKKVWDAKGS
jgi:hypothetical protein